MKHSMKRVLANHLVQILTALVGSLAVFFLIGFREQEPPWIQDMQTMFIGAGFAVAYFIGFFLLSLRVNETETVSSRLMRVLGIGALVCFPVVLIMLLGKFEYRNLTILIEISAVFGLLFIAGFSWLTSLTLLLNVVVFGVGLLPSLSQTGRASFGSFISSGVGTSLKKDDSTEFVFSSLYDLKVVSSDVGLGRPDAVGGGISPIDDSRLLLVNGEGVVSVLTLENGGRIIDETLDRITIQMNRDAFVENAKPSARQWFRVTDAMLGSSEIANHRTLFVAYHHWDSVNDCITLNVDGADLDVSHLNKPLEWTNLFTSSPCLPYKTMFNATGGRLALRGNDSLLITVGITIGGHEASSPKKTENSMYGKIVEVNLSNGVLEVFSEGHRNPQGLLVTENGDIWSTEHGPRGGDELNLVEHGFDYGWPDSSYGTEYTSKVLNGNDTPGDHSVGRRPAYAWVPSIGVSNLLEVSGKAFPSWQGALLVGSLSGRGNGYSLFRVKTVENVVQVVERINTGKRVRDLVEMSHGEIVLWDGINTIQVVTPASHVFTACSGCHAFYYLQHGIAPDLMDVVGSKVARHSGFEYSAAMREFGGRWTPQRLDAFIKNPQKVIPGTAMKIPGIEDENLRAAIVKYLTEAPSEATR